MIIRIKTNKNNGENKMNESKQMMVFENHKVEIFELDGQVLFNPRHVGECLDLDEVTVRRHIQEMNEKQVVKLTNDSIVHLMNFRKLHNTGENFLTESGVYKLIFKSRKPSAEKFQDWVTDVVLPTIRKTGSFSIHTENETKIPDYKNALDSLTFHMAAAQIFGFNHSQAMFQTNRIVKQQFQIDTMKNLGIANVVSPVQEKYYSATELGHKFGGLSAQKINNMMEQAGIIKASRNKKGEKVWEITEYGLNNNLALYKDSGKSHSDGTPIQHHYFFESAWHNANDLLN